MKVLHITGHLGGGVGTVVLSYLSYKVNDTSQTHTVISLDTLNSNARDQLQRLGIAFYSDCYESFEQLCTVISEHDIVVLHWWNHPLISSLLICKGLPPCRLVIWSHISGTPAPNCFSERLFEIPDRFVFTTPLSYLDPVYAGLPQSIKSRVDVIWSTAGVERLANVHPIAHKEKNVGYIGNLDFTKISSSFGEICEALADDATFTVVGPPNSDFSEHIASLAPSAKVRLTGFISESEKWSELARFDVFGYPLAPHHYGTCDQTIQEAMAVGVVPVVLANPMESYMVEHNVTGLVAKSIPEYVEYIKVLLVDVAFKSQLAKNAREYAFETFSIKKSVLAWDQLLADICDSSDKRPRLWSDRPLENEPHHVFIESLGRYGEVFREDLVPKHFTNASTEGQLRALSSLPQWQSHNKSTAHQFASFFPSDPVLKRWSELTSKE